MGELGASANMISVSSINDERGLAELEPAWDSLVASSCEDNPFRRWLWAWTWWKYYGLERKLAVVVAHDGGELVGILPLFLERNRWWATRELRLLGSTVVCPEYLGPIVRRGMEEQVATALFEFLLGRWGGQWDAVCLTELPLKSPEVSAIESAGRQRGLPVAVQARPPNLVVDLAETWEQYVASLSSKRRTKLRRVQREFADLAGGELVLAERPEEFGEQWNEMVSLHNRHWEHEGQQGCFASERFEAFHREVAAEFLRQGVLVLGSLRVDGKAIASCYGFRVGDTVYEYQRGHDPVWLPRRPGHALQFHLFRRMMGRGVRRWDYLRGDYPHKRDWATSVRDTADLTIAAPGVFSAQRFYLRQAVHGARQIARWCRHTAATLCTAMERKLQPDPEGKA